MDIKQKLTSKRLIIQRDYITECWEFTGYINPKGYGYIRYNGDLFRVHILAYQVYVGNYNPKLNVNHKCHNRKCFNPDHVYQGTQAQNVQDSILRGTHKNPLIAWNKSSKNRGHWNGT